MYDLQSIENEIAIIYEGRKISYASLSVGIANCMSIIHKKKIDKGVIGVMLPRTPDYIYWIIAILASGYTFVPINEHDTEEKKQYIIQNANLDFCVTASNYSLQIQEREVDYSFNFADVLDYGEKAAYIMYTSGTTGKPKGVMIPRRALKYFVDCFLVNEIKQGDLFLSNTSFTFDISLMEIFLTLSRRATLYLTSDAEQKNPRAIGDILEKNSFDWVQFTPSYLNMLIEYCRSMSIFKNVKNLIVGGERITKSMVKHNVICLMHMVQLKQQFGHMWGT